MAEKYANRRQKQKAIAMDKSVSPEERMQAQFALQKFPKNSARCRIRNRCKITGRSRSSQFQAPGMNLWNTVPDSPGCGL